MENGKNLLSYGDEILECAVLSRATLLIHSSKQPKYESIFMNILERTFERIICFPNLKITENYTFRRVRFTVQPTFYLFVIDNMRENIIK
jgi:hypothetical protein